jgi:hypothetical protein
MKISYLIENHPNIAAKIDRVEVLDQKFFDEIDKKIKALERLLER